MLKRKTYKLRLTSKHGVFPFFVKGFIHHRHFIDYKSTLVFNIENKHQIIVGQ